MSIFFYTFAHVIKVLTPLYDMKSTKRNVLITAGVLLFLLLGAGLYAGIRRYRYTRCNLVSIDGKEHGYYVYPDTSLDSIFALVKADYKIRSGYAFRKDLKRSQIRRAKPGYYLFPAEMGNRMLMMRLRQGEQTPVKIRFAYTVRTNEHLAGKLGKQLMTDSASIIALLKNDDFLSRYEMNTETARCLFMPDTYEVYWTITPEQLFDRMYREYRRFWTEKRREEAAALGLTPQQVYTLASIVTSETTNPQEYPVIAGLYLNRMRIGMHLQACPTAVYATRNFGARRVTHSMTHFKSPYNTYLNPGLPPGPIRVTSAEVIDSTLHATRSKYLYMCANPDFSGTHVFSESYKKHASTARQYQSELNKRRIRH